MGKGGEGGEGRGRKGRGLEWWMRRCEGYGFVVI